MVNLATTAMRIAILVPLACCKGQGSATGAAEQGRDDGLGQGAQSSGLMDGVAGCKRTDCGTRKPCLVSIIRLVGSPAEFGGCRVLTEGYLRVAGGGRLYPNRDDGERMLLLNSIIITGNGIHRIQDGFGEYVEIEGVFVPPFAGRDPAAGRLQYVSEPRVQLSVHGSYESEPRPWEAHGPEVAAEEVEKSGRAARSGG